MIYPNRDYLAVDPGETSGWALLSITGAHHSGQLSYEAMIDSVDETAGSLSILNVPILLAVERAWAPSQNARTNLPSLIWEMETIGCMKWIVRKYNLPPLEEISQADSKDFAKNDLLERIGWWNLGQQHANDASRVLARVVSNLSRQYWRSIVLESGLLDG